MSFDWKKYVAFGDEITKMSVQPGMAEAYLRAAISRIYYGAYWECRGYQRAIHSYTPPYHSAHTSLIKQYVESSSKEERKIGKDLQTLQGLRMQQIEKESLECKEELAIWNRKRVIEQLGGPEYMEELDRQRRAKGVKIRLIAVKDEENVFKGGEADETREIRYAPKGMEIPMAVSIFDTGKVGYITSQAEKFGILIESKELETTMRTLFESFWKQCKA